MSWGDYDNDGDLDLYLANDRGANKLLRNDGGGVFADVTSGPLGRHRAWPWGGHGGTTTTTGTSTSTSPTITRRKQALAQQRGRGFLRICYTTGPLGDTALVAGGCRVGDYDNDGDLDLYLADYDGANKLLRNDGGFTFLVGFDE